MVLGDLAGFAEGLGDLAWCCPPGSVSQASTPIEESMRTPPVGRMPISRICWPMAQALRTWLRKRLTLVGIAHGRAAAGAAPDRRDERADLEAEAGDVVG